MIRIDRKDFFPPEIKLEKIIKKVLQEKKQHSFSTYYINRINKDLKKLYLNKCGYCEVHMEAGEGLGFDHYRPKNGIKEDRSHSGYYWLGYEWSNFVPVCPSCNRHKANSFPIEGERTNLNDFLADYNRTELVNERCRVDSDLLKAEKPVLLHPEIDIPGEHLVFLPSGEIKGTSRRGEKTIHIYGLNRNALVIARKRIVDRFLSEIRKELNDFIDKKNNKKVFLYSLKKVLHKIFTSGDKKKQYSRLGWHMINQFESFFMEPLGPKQQKILRKAFASFQRDLNRDKT